MAPTLHLHERTHDVLMMAYEQSAHTCVTPAMDTSRNTSGLFVVILLFSTRFHSMRTLPSPRQHRDTSRTRNSEATVPRRPVTFFSKAKREEKGKRPCRPNRTVGDEVIVIIVFPAKSMEQKEPNARCCRNFGALLRKIKASGHKTEAWKSDQVVCL
jgi:hypothetical protein